MIGYHEKPTLLIMHCTCFLDDAEVHWVQELAGEYFPDFHVESISMDTAVDSVLGDLCEGDSLTHLT